MLCKIIHLDTSRCFCSWIKCQQNVTRNHQYILFYDYKWSERKKTIFHPASLRIVALETFWFWWHVVETSVRSLLLTHCDNLMFVGRCLMHNTQFLKLNSVAYWEWFGSESPISLWKTMYKGKRWHLENTEEWNTKWPVHIKRNLLNKPVLKQTANK